ncbi:hypothetical protein GBAR_LOCUS10527, partial [Geodia barretti]
VRPYIVTIPEGPIFQAGREIKYYCKVIAPGAFSFKMTKYCVHMGSENLAYQSPLSTNTTETSFIINSTPTYCMDKVGCTAWDDAGSTAEDKLSVHVTGVGLVNFHGSEMPNNTCIEATSDHQLGIVYCMSASTSQPDIGRWISPSGEDILSLMNDMFDVYSNTHEFYSYTFLRLRDGVQFN